MGFNRKFLYKTLHKDIEYDAFNRPKKCRFKAVVLYYFLQEVYRHGDDGCYDNKMFVASDISCGLPDILVHRIKEASSTR